MYIGGALLFSEIALTILSNLSFTNNTCYRSEFLPSSLSDRD